MSDTIINFRRRSKTYTVLPYLNAFCVAPKNLIKMSVQWGAHISQQRRSNLYEKNFYSGNPIGENFKSPHSKDWREGDFAAIFLNVMIVVQEKIEILTFSLFSPEDLLKHATAIVSWIETFSFWCVAFAFLWFDLTFYF